MGCSKLECDPASGQATGPMVSLKLSYPTETATWQLPALESGMTRGLENVRAVQRHPSLTAGVDKAQGSHDVI